MGNEATSYESPRLSTRIRAQIPVRVTTLEGPSFSESCHTVIVNINGCGMRLSKPLEPGLPVRLNEMPSAQAVNGRVANCVPLGPKHWLVGVALDEPGNIWGIHPVPPDWGIEPKAMAAGAGMKAPSKKGEWPFSQFSSKGEFHPGRK